MRALGWLGLIGAVAVLAYSALCLSVPFKVEAHYTERLQPEEAVLLHWAMTSWPPQDWWPSDAMADSDWTGVMINGDSVQCALTTVAGGRGTRTLWITQGPEGQKLHEHLIWKVPFFLRGLGRLKGQSRKPGSMGRSVILEVLRKAQRPSVQLPWGGGAFVPVSLTFDRNLDHFQAPDSLSADAATLWCWSWPTTEGEKWQWMQEVDETHLDSVLAAGGEGWSAMEDTLDVWEMLPSAESALALLDVLEGTLDPADSAGSVWAMRWSDRTEKDQNETAPQSETTALFRFKRTKISER